MKSKVRICALACSCFVLMGAITGCSSAQTSNPVSQGSESKQAETTKITVAYQVNGNIDPIGTWLKKLITEYKTKAPGVEIVPAPITADENTYYTKLDLEMKTASTCPDIVEEDTFLINSDAAAGYLEPIDDRVSGWSEWSSFITNVKQGVTGQDKKIYGVPFNTDSRGIWYNKAIFQQSGLPAEWNPKNWNDILDACKAIKAKFPDVTPFFMYNGKATGEATTMQAYEMLLYGTGERLLDDSGKWIVKSPGILSTLNFIDSIYKNGYGAKASLITNAQSGGLVAQQMLPKGQLAMDLDGNWVSSNWLDGAVASWADFQKTMGFVAMPTQNGQDPKSITLSGGWAWSITKNSKNKDAAFDFIKEMTSESNMKDLAIAQGDLATRTDVANDPEYSATPFYKQASDFLEAAQFRPANTQYPTVSTAIQTMVESVATSTATPEEAMSNYANDVKRIVGEENVVTIQ